jgi:heme oxygenase
VLYDAGKCLYHQITMPNPTPSTLHQQLRLATKEPHHALDHHPLMARLLAPDISRREYGDALVAMHGVVASAEAALLAYLSHHPALFDYAPRRKLAALEADLARCIRWKAQRWEDNLFLPDCVSRGPAIFHCSFTRCTATRPGHAG